MLSYKNLWKKLIDENLKRTDLIRLAGISSATLAKLGDDKAVSMETLVKICNALDCEISDIVSVSAKKDMTL